MRGLWKVVAMLMPVLAFSAALFAQAGIVGNVRDMSGAVLPGVTVEASSPALIEKVRSVVTDSTGQYQNVDLRPGIYTVTFTLPGFSTVKREGIELSGSFVASVNAELRVGAIEETITVSGETPVVDVRSVKTQSVLSDETVQTYNNNYVPTAAWRTPNGVLPPRVVRVSGQSDF
jgi:hypothetical protein